MKDTYYKERVSPHTSTVTEPISVFIWRFINYGEIDHDAIKEEENRVCEIIYDLCNSITDVFEPIQELG